MLNKDQKKKLVKDLQEKIKKSKATVFADFKGLTVNDLNILKSQLREAGVEFKVMKKTLMQIAFKNEKIDVDVKGMDGQIAIAVSLEDEVSAAKIINNFSKKNENIKILSGVLDSKIMNLEEVKALALLPSKEELLAKLVGSLKSPISGFASVLSGNLRGLVQVLKAVSENKK